MENKHIAARGGDTHLTAASHSPARAWRTLSSERLRSKMESIKQTQNTLEKARVVRRETLKSTISV